MVKMTSLRQSPLAGEMVLVATSLPMEKNNTYGQKRYGNAMVAIVPDTRSQLYRDVTTHVAPTPTGRLAQC